MSAPISIIIPTFNSETDLHDTLGSLFEGVENNLISSIDPHFKSSGSQSLLIFEAIKFLSNKTKSSLFIFPGEIN